MRPDYTRIGRVRMAYAPWDEPPDSIWDDVTACVWAIAAFLGIFLVAGLR